MLQSFINSLRNIDYGILYNEKVIYDEDYISKNYSIYKTLTPQNFEKYKIGTCWDIVNYIDFYLKHNLNLTYKLIMFNVEGNVDNPEKTHTFVVYQNKGWNLVEASWEKYFGIYNYNSLEELLNDYLEKFSQLYDNETTFCAYEYKVHSYEQNVIDYIDNAINGKLLQKLYNI